VLSYEAHLNSLLAGNRVGRRQMPVLVHGMEIKSMKQADLKNEFDEWLARNKNRNPLEQPRRIVPRPH